MQTKLNAIGQPITYKRPMEGTFSEGESLLYETALEDAESALAVITEIQNGRTNEDDEIAKPLAHTHVRTILEMSTYLERSLAILEALEEGL